MTLLDPEQIARSRYVSTTVSYLITHKPVTNALRTTQKYAGMERLTFFRERHSAGDPLSFRPPEDNNDDELAGTARQRIQEAITLTLQEVEDDLQDEGDTENEDGDSDDNDIDDLEEVDSAMSREVTSDELQ